MFSTQCHHLIASALLLACCAVTLAQTNEYVDYRPGTLNLILSAPHGGLVQPATIRNRTAGCYVADKQTCVYRHDCTPDKKRCPVVTEYDTNTFQAAEKLRKYIFDFTGKYPYFVAMKLHRIKLDANREVNMATFGEPVAVAAYDSYHSTIGQARDDILKSFQTALLIDVHGQSHSHNLTELGYNLTSAELDADSYSLQSTSTVRFAADRLQNDHGIITGSASLGYFMEKQSIKCMPSPTNPKVNGLSYFDGGYTVETHSSSTYDAIQIEFARPMRLGSSKDFDANMQKTARAIVDFMQLHYSS